MPTPSVGNRKHASMPCSSMHSQTGVAVAVLRADRLELAERGADVVAGRLAAEVVVEHTGLGDGIERGVRDEAVDPPADHQALLAVEVRPLHRPPLASAGRGGG